ncbi:MAG: response regulator transcription factor [Pseudoxanthomonas suwonensis]|nr:response regulator transcription factor [Pseudoxanthomonas suwonensis]
MNVRVVILDDHAVVRTGFRMILSHHADIEVVGEAETGEQALDMVRRLKPDVLLCDLHLPGISGLEVTERVVRGKYGTRVMVLSILDDGPLPRRLLECGASGYLCKACPADELVRAVRAVANGGRYLDAGIAQQMALAGIQGEGSPFDTLTSRELEVAMLLVQGRRPDDIAKRLSLSPKTVSTHKCNLFQKLGVDDNIALARLAGQHGLSDPACVL